MGWFIKIILFFIVFAWIFRGITRFMAGVSGQTQARGFRSQQDPRKRTGDINVDYKPNRSRKNKTSNDYKGGDYIDYEEVD